MRESFYHFMKNQRDPNKKDQMTKLAFHIADDGMFPKTSSDYDEISRYLETNVDYVPSMVLFEEAWDKYQSLKQS